MQIQQETNQDSSSSSSSSSSAAKAATTETEAVIVVRSTEEEEEEEDDDEMEKCNVEKEKENVKSNILVKLSEEETENNCVIVDIKDECDFGGISLNNNNKDGEKVCRICHLNAAECTSSSSASAEKLDLIKLGCGCKDELGIAHRHCAEAWFKLKGNRRCEICGETAKNITGVGDDRFMEEWNERSDESSGNTDQRRGFFRGQPFCNFLMACLVILFVIPWFFHVNMV